MEADEGARVRFVRQDVLCGDLEANVQVLADAYITWVMFRREGPYRGIGIGAIDAGSAENSSKSIALADLECVLDYRVWSDRALCPPPRLRPYGTGAGGVDEYHG